MADYLEAVSTASSKVCSTAFSNELVSRIHRRESSGKCDIVVDIGHNKRRVKLAPKIERLIDLPSGQLEISYEK